MFKFNYTVYRSGAPGVSLGQEAHGIASTYHSATNQAPKMEETDRGSCPLAECTPAVTIVQFDQRTPEAIVVGMTAQLRERVVSSEEYRRVTG